MKVYYDADTDILYIAKKGKQAEVVELSPGINLELDENGQLIGIEMLHASRLFKDVIKPLEQRAAL